MLPTRSMEQLMPGSDIQGYGGVGSRCKRIGSWWHLRKAHPIGGSFHGGTSCEERSHDEEHAGCFSTFLKSLYHIVRRMFLCFASKHTAGCIVLIAANHWLAEALQTIAGTQAIVLEKNCINCWKSNTGTEQVLFSMKSSTNSCFRCLDLVFTAKTFLWLFSKLMCKCKCKV